MRPFLLSSHSFLVVKSFAFSSWSSIYFRSNNLQTFNLPFSSSILSFCSCLATFRNNDRILHPGCSMRFSILICTFIISKLFLVSSLQQEQQYSRYSRSQNDHYALPYYKDWGGSPLTTALDDVFTYCFFSIRASYRVLKELLSLGRSFLCFPDKLLVPFWHVFYFTASPLFKFMYHAHRPSTVYFSPLPMLPPPPCDSKLESCSSQALSGWYRRGLSLIYRTAVYIPRPVYSLFILAALAVCVTKANYIQLIRQNRVVLIFQSRQRLCVILAISFGLYTIRPLIIELVNYIGILFATFQSLLLLATYIVLHLSVPFCLLFLVRLLLTQVIAFEPWPQTRN